MFCSRFYLALVMIITNSNGVKFLYQESKLVTTINYIFVIAGGISVELWSEL